MEKQYTISNFIYHELSNNQIVIQTDKTITKLADIRMRTLLNFIEENSMLTITTDQIRQIFNEDSDEAIRFLISNQILRDKIELNFNVQSVRLLTNNTDIGLLVDGALSEKIPNWSFSTELNSYSLDEQQNMFYVIFLNPYDQHLARELAQKLRQLKESYSMMSYMYNNHFYIDSIYSPQWMSPCHSCQIAHIQSQLRLGASHRLTYQALIDELYTEQSSFVVGTPLTQHQKMNIAVQLSNRIDRFCTVNSGSNVRLGEYAQAVVMDIFDYQIHTDSTYHWELCDCYEQ